MKSKCIFFTVYSCLLSHLTILLKIIKDNFSLDQAGILINLKHCLFQNHCFILSGFVVLAFTTIASLGIVLPRYLSITSILCTLVLTLSAGVIALFHIDFTNWIHFFPSRFDGVCVYFYHYLS